MYTPGPIVATEGLKRALGVVNLHEPIEAFLLLQEVKRWNVAVYGEARLYLVGVLFHPKLNGSLRALT